MNESRRESLSALMDGALDKEQLRFVLAGLASDGDGALCWSRYHLAGQVLRRERPLLLDDKLAQAVMAAIANEPLASQPRLGQRVLRWGAGGAIAASVALVALLATRPADGPVSAPLATPTPSLARTTPLAVNSATSIAALPASATTSSFGIGEVRPPLLAPNAPIDSAPASYGVETTLVPALDPRFSVYARGGANVPAGGGYVLLLTPSERKSETASRRNH